MAVPRRHPLDVRGLAGALVLLATGCAAPPSAPDRELREPATEQAIASILGAAEPAASDAAALAGPWWEGFESEELNDLVSRALRDGPDLGVMQARVDAAARAEAVVGLETGLRHETEASLERHRLSDTGLLPVDLVGKSYTQTRVAHSVAWQADWWGRNRALLRAARGAREAAADELAAARLHTAAAVSDAWFAWAGAEALKGLAASLVDVRTREWQVYEHRHAVGLDGVGESLAARQRLEATRERLEQLRLEARVWRQRVSTLAGQDPDEAAGLSAPRLDVRLPEVPAALPLGWLGQRPDIASLRARIEAATARHEAARAAFYPDLDLRAMVGLESLDIARLVRSGSLIGALGASLRLPLFERETLKAHRAVREAELDAAISAYDRAILEAAAEAVDAYARVASLERRHRQRQAARMAGVEQLEVSRVRLGLGLADGLEALRDEGALLERQMGEVETQAARLRARVDLFRTLGGGPVRKPAEAETEQHG